MSRLSESVDRVQIPLRGFGTFQADPTLYPPGTAKRAVLAALEAGYRHIDTAYEYSNGQIEREVGQAIRESLVPRDELFIVTKLHNTFHAPEDVEVGIDRSLKSLGLEYVDLYLMHNAYAYAKGPDYSTLRHDNMSGKPVMDLDLSRRYPETWKAMAALVQRGKTRYIGLSNFNLLKVKRILKETGIRPAANQIEVNPYFPQYDLVDFCMTNQIQVIAHCPLGGALAASVMNRKTPGPLHDPQIRRIAAAHSKTPAQIILAWLVGRGICVVPKSAKTDRIQENFDIMFPLSETEDQEIAGLMGPRGELGIRNLVNKHRIGFDVFDELLDQPAFS